MLSLNDFFICSSFDLLISASARRMGIEGEGACPQKGLISERTFWQDYGHFTGIFCDFTGIFSSIVRTFHQLGAPGGTAPNTD